MRRKAPAAEGLFQAESLPWKGANPSHAPRIQNRQPLWCALVFPDLSLEVCISHADSPAAVTDINGKKILSANLAARDSGVYSGQSYTSAIVVCPGLRVTQRNVLSEKLILNSIAELLQQFSPQIICEEESIIFEISGSLRLFGGIDQLKKKIKETIKARRFRYEMAISPTILSALWRARSAQVKAVFNVKNLPSEMAPLPIDVMGMGKELRSSLQAIGIENLADLIRMPRAGMARRYGWALVDTLDRAMGRKPDPRAMWKAPEYFEKSLEFYCETDSRKLLDQGIIRLSDQLSYFLCQRQLAIRRLIVEIHTNSRVYEGNPESYHPVREGNSIVWMVSNWLDAIRLDSPAWRLVFRAREFISFQPDQGLNFSKAIEQERLRVAVDGIRSRFGNAAIVRVGISPDHRPEMATQKVSLDSVRKIEGREQKGWPLFLLSQAVNLHGIVGKQDHGEGMKIMGGPERIESGWWDGNDVSRDYYRVRSSDGAELWVFNDLRSGNWYLQGYFL